MQPRPSSRIKSLETRATTIEAAIEELSSDTAETLNALSAKVDQGFAQAHAFVQQELGEIKATQVDHTKRLDRIESDVTSIKGDVAKILALLQQKDK